MVTTVLVFDDGKVWISNRGWTPEKEIVLRTISTPSYSNCLAAKHMKNGHDFQVFAIEQPKDMVIDFFTNVGWHILRSYRDL